MTKHSSQTILSSQTELELAEAETSEGETSGEEDATANPCRPFVKWAGGKRQLLTELLARVPTQVSRYLEPFAGGAALFFAKGFSPQRAYLSDTNQELINTYLVVRDKVTELIEDLKKHEHSSDYFYALRNIDRSEEYAKWGSVERASRMLYLNRTCYNGLYRVNSKGQFNTPFGDYKNPKIVDEENLLACSQALQGAVIECDSFLKIEDITVAGDFVYFDPPYAPLSRTASFTSYTYNGFTPEDHQALASLCKRLDQKGVRFLLSNSTNSAIKPLYEGFRIEEISASRSINSKGQKRGKVTELLISN